MTNKKLAFLQTAMELLLMSTTYIALMAGVLCGILGKPDTMLWKSVWILIPVLITYFLRRKVKNYFLFIAGHIVLAIGAVVIAGNEYDATFYLAAVAAVCVHSIRLQARLTDKSLYMSNPTNVAGATSSETADVMSALAASERMSPYYAIVMVACYILGGYKGSTGMQNVEVILFVAFVILQVLYNQLQKVNKVIYTNRDKSEFPAKQMVRINAITAVLIVSLMLIAMLLFYYGPYGNIFTIVGTGLMAVFRLLLRIILAIWGSGPNKASTPVEEETTTVMEETEFETEEGYEPSHVMEALAETIGIVLILATLGAVIYMIIGYAKRASSAKHEGLDEVEFIKESNRKETVNEQTEIREKHKGGSQNSQYRKLYKKKVFAGNHKKKPDGTLPPESLTKQTITEQEETAKRITQAYEKARYSRENVDKEEIEFLKKM
ncbi:MAG: hypothetical protein PHW47_06675 [Lachnospira sp.]|nr:hypothetical protein [Lachnospira sp.]